MTAVEFIAFEAAEKIEPALDVLVRIAEKIEDGTRWGWVDDFLYRLDLDAFGHFMPAIATYVKKGQMSGALLGKDWKLEVIASKAPPTLREEAEAKVREITPEAEGTPLWDFMVENVRNLLENDGAKIVFHELSESEEETLRLAREKSQ